MGAKGSGTRTPPNRTRLLRDTPLGRTVPEVQNFMDAVREAQADGRIDARESDSYTKMAAVAMRGAIAEKEAAELEEWKRVAERMEAAVSAGEKHAADARSHINNTDREAEPDRDLGDPPTRH